jgi:RNA ligase
MIGLEDIQNNYSKGYISIRKHPFVELYILNYTPLASRKAVWNEITLTSRGLIIDKKGNIISYPFRKFFELEQLPSHLIPKTSPLQIYEKLDGALGIMYWHKGKPYISTRGSFSSYQAVRATEILHTKYRKQFLF